MESQASEVAHAIEALYGERDLLAKGIVHVSATARGADGQLHVIQIGLESPKSTTDFFVLNLCRARSDAILTTAANLRAERTLRHDLQGPWASHLASYRRSALRKDEPPVSVILTGSGDLPVEHPTWEDGTPKLVLTSEATAPALRWLLGSRARVVPLAGLDARRACAYLRDAGHALISIEAGPTTARALYEGPSLVDELLLSIYEEPLRDALVGNALPPEERLFAGRLRVSEQLRNEESGRWRFQRWLRPSLTDT